MTASTPQIRHEYRASGAPSWGAAFMRDLHIPFVVFVVLSNFSIGSWFIWFWVAALVVQLVYSVRKDQIGLNAVSDKRETRKKQCWFLTLITVTPLLVYIIVRPEVTSIPLALLGTAFTWAASLVNSRYNAPWVYTEERQIIHHD